MDEAGRMGEVRAIGRGELVESDPTPGMTRLRAFAAPGLWAGVVHTEPGAASGWHHHGAHETSLFVVEGVLRLESGADGTSVAQAGPGAFLHVPAGAVHRESNPGEVRSTAVIARSGYGAPTVNVDGPGPPVLPGDGRARRYAAAAGGGGVSGAGARYVEHDRTADLSVGCYVPDAGAIDEQVPHTEDEVYVVVSGSATLWTPDVALPARPGDVLLVPAGLDHRFVDIGDDFRVVVVFGPAEYARGSRESS